MANKPLIMVVEHNQKTQDIVRMDLETIGYKILPVLTTEEAWKLLEEGTNLDVMVLGFHFPGEDGPAFYRRLKGCPFGNRDLEYNRSIQGSGGVAPRFGRDPWLG